MLLARNVLQGQIHRWRALTSSHARAMQDTRVTTAVPAKRVRWAPSRRLPEELSARAALQTRRHLLAASALSTVWQGLRCLAQAGCVAKATPGLLMDHVMLVRQEHTRKRRVVMPARTVRLIRCLVLAARTCLPVRRIQAIRVRCPLSCQVQLGRMVARGKESLLVRSGRTRATRVAWHAVSVPPTLRPLLWPVLTSLPAKLSPDSRAPMEAPSLNARLAPSRIVSGVMHAPSALLILHRHLRATTPLAACLFRWLLM